MKTISRVLIIVMAIMLYANIQNSKELLRQLEVEKNNIKTITKEVEVIKEVSSIPYEKAEMEVTAYTNGFESCGKLPSHPEYGITASGKKTKANWTIAMGKKYKFGTKVYIPELGRVFICEDRGSKIKDDKIDVFMESRIEALKFGRKKMTVYILKEDL